MGKAERPSFVKWLLQRIKGLSRIKGSQLRLYIGFIILFIGPFTAARLYYWMPGLWTIWLPAGLLSFLYGLYLMDTAFNR